MAAFFSPTVMGEWTGAGKNIIKKQIDLK